MPRSTTKTPESHVEIKVCKSSCETFISFSNICCKIFHCAHSIMLRGTFLKGTSAAMKCVDSWHVVFYTIGVSAKFICFLPRHYGSREQHKRQGDFIGAIAVKAN
jgi:hypothetical protein